MSDVLVLLAVVAVVAALTWALRRREGAVAVVSGRVDAARRAALGAPAEGTLLLQLTAPACTSCAAARRVLDEVADARAGVSVHAVDVAEAIDLVREHRILRAPTTLVVDPHGAVRARIGGVPDPAALAVLLDGAGVRVDAA